jgi:broad specificity phosphatase PhoE
MPALLLVRHCESSGPRPDAALTERGRIPAARLARFRANPGVYLLDGGRRLRFDRLWRADES